MFKNEKQASWFIYIFSIVVTAVVAILLFAPTLNQTDSKAIYFLPRLNAGINFTVSLLLISAIIAIKKKNQKIHRAMMIIATVLSLLFLVSYVFYHASAPSTKFGGEGFVKNIYFFILITHIVLAAIILPFVLFTLYRGITNQLDKHKKIARWTFPIWLYVTITGVVVYLMISPYYPV